MSAHVRCTARHRKISARFTEAHLGERISDDIVKGFDVPTRSFEPHAGLLTPEKKRTAIFQDNLRAATTMLTKHVATPRCERHPSGFTFAPATARVPTPNRRLPLPVAASLDPEYRQPRCARVLLFVDRRNSSGEGGGERTGRDDELILFCFSKRRRKSWPTLFISILLCLLRVTAVYTRHAYGHRPPLASSLRCSYRNGPELN